MPAMTLEERYRKLALADTKKGEVPKTSPFVCVAGVNRDYCSGLAFATRSSIGSRR